MTDVQTHDSNGQHSPRPGSRITLADGNREGVKISVIGVGGGGGNAVNRMVASELQGVHFVAVNTDIQALKGNSAATKLQLGHKVTKGLGAGADPNLGRQAALEDTEKLLQTLDGADMVFVAAGLGGGTGTGAAPVIASLASELGALTIAIVTKPFGFEGKTRALQAERGLDALKDVVDSVITIPNERLLASTSRSTSLVKAFAKADDVLRLAVQGISDLILVPGLINLDFADVTTIMHKAGIAIMGTGTGEGSSRAKDAANEAITSPLLEHDCMKGAHGVMFNVTGGSDLSLIEIGDASAIIHEAAHEDANIIFGAVIDPKMGKQVKITVIATGFEGGVIAQSSSSTPVDLQNYSAWQSDARATETPNKLLRPSGSKKSGSSRRTSGNDYRG